MQKLQKQQTNSFLYKNWGKIHDEIHFVSLVIFAISLPTSEFGMSVSMFALFGNWLFDIFISRKLFNTPLNTKFKIFWQNKEAILIFSFLVIHVLGIIHSEDIQNAIKDIRIKIPIGVFVLVLASEKKLSKKQLRQIIIFFILSVFTATIICFIKFLRNDYVDIRDISIFISHIRFGLMIALSIFLSFYLVIKHFNRQLLKLVFVFIPLWLLLYLTISENITGLTIIFISILILSIRFIFKSKNRSIKILTISSFFILLLVTVIISKPIYKDVFNVNKVDLSTLDQRTINGEKYEHIIKMIDQTENGNHVWLYFAPNELEANWNRISNIDYMGKDKLNQDVRITLIRFLTSKGLRKDSVGLSKLTNEEILAVENGIANYKFMNKASIRNRIHQIFWEIKKYSKYGDASGHSVAMRFEFWKIGLSIIKDNFLVGIGTGDIKTEYDNRYIASNSKIVKKWRYLSHNQFIYITICLGIAGLAWFLFVLFYPPIKLKKFNYFPFAIFFIIVFLSFFTEDTLTSQAGVCFFAFFFPLFLFNPKD